MPWLGVGEGAHCEGSQGECAVVHTVHIIAIAIHIAVGIVVVECGLIRSSASIQQSPSRSIRNCSLFTSIQLHWWMKRRMSCVVCRGEGRIVVRVGGAGHDALIDGGGGLIIIISIASSIAIGIGIGIVGWRGGCAAVGRWRCW